MDHPNPSSHPEETPTEAGAQAIVPPYWQNHRRFESYSSISHLRPTPISLHDNTEVCPGESSPLWAKTVSIDDYVLISGSIPSVGDYIVWNCHIEMLHGGSMMLRKRYTDFEDLRSKLLTTFPNAGQALPPLPPKNFLNRFKPSFLDKRRTGLAYFLNCVLLNPEFAAAPILKDFVFD